MSTISGVRKTASITDEYSGTNLEVVVHKQGSLGGIWITRNEIATWVPLNLEDFAKVKALFS